MSNIGLPAPFTARPATMDDLDATVAFFNICEIDESGAPDYEIDEVRADWEDLNLSSNTRLALDTRGEIVASMIVTPRGQESADAAGYTHPTHRGNGLGAAMVRWSEHRAIELARETGEPIALRNWISTRNPAAAELLSAAGFAHSRRFYRMGIDLTAEPRVPQLPDEYKFRPVEVDRDIAGMYEAIEDAFSEHWEGHQRTYEEWREDALGFGFAPQYWIQIFRGNQRVAAVIGQNLSGIGWIKAIGVRKAERGKGLGKALLLQEFARYWQDGLTSVELGVDSENVTSAKDLYERAGMSETNSYDSWEKSLSGGVQGPVPLQTPQ